MKNDRSQNNDERGHIPGTGWNGMLESVRKFVSKNRRFPESKAQGHEKVLGLWCRRQRQKYGPDCQERIRTLESIPGWRWKRMPTGVFVMPELSIGQTFSHMAQGANALCVGGKDDTLVVELDDHNLILLKPDGSTSPMRYRGVVMLCNCGHKNTYYVEPNDDGFDSFLGLECGDEGCSECGQEFDNLTIHEVEEDVRQDDGTAPVV